MIKWKNENLKDYGIIVEETPVISKGKKNIDVYTIPGRSGFLSVDNNTYESVVISLSCHFEENCDFNKIKGFLDGYGTLELENGIEYTGIIQNSISFEKVLMFKKFIVQFLVNPISEETIVIERVIESSATTFEIEDATADMYPDIEITGSGDLTITINNSTFKILNADGTYLLNSKLKIITKDGINASSNMLYDFPKLIPGTNSISYLGDVTSFKIRYRKAFL